MGGSPARELLRGPDVSRRVPRIAFRVGGAFGAVLLFFILALVVTDRTLDEIGRAEEEVEALDRAKHAGHHVAAMAREMYIHQAHTIVTFGFSHLGHYEEWVGRTRQGTERLLAIAPSPSDRARAREIADLAAKIDVEFKRLIIPAIERGDREHILELHARIDAIRQQVISTNRSLAADFERRSDEARDKAEALRGQARLAILGCSGLAAVAAALLGVLLLRSVLGPISVLRAGALRLAAGDLDHRIEWSNDDEFGELAETFNGMTAELAEHQEAALKAQRLTLLGEVTAGVAHEINNPLGVILGYLKLIEKDGNASPERLKTIEDEARQCQRIVQDLLEVVRPAELEPSHVDLGALVHASVERLREASAHGDLVVKIEEGVETWGDPNKLRQVLDNLLSNATDASPEGTVRVSVRAVGGDARVRVTDSGIGVPPELEDRIFDPFFTTKTDGTGLGLAISRAIVEAHGGRIELLSHESGGCFEVSLPLAREKERGAAS